MTPAVECEKLRGKTELATVSSAPFHIKLDSLRRELRIPLGITSSKLTVSC